MDPFSWMSMIGMGANLLGNLFGGKKQMPEQINPLTDQYYQQVLNELGNWNNKQSGAIQDVKYDQSGVRRQANAAQNIQKQQANVNAPGANDWFDAFMEEQLPGYREEAAKAAEMATRGGSAGQAERAQELSRQAAQNAAAQFGGRGMFSGAANEAVGQGAANPLAAYQNQMGQDYQNAFMGAYQPLASQGQQLAYRGQQDAFNNTMNQLGQQLNSAQVAGNMFGNSANIGTNLANLFGQRAQGAESWRNDVAQPFYATPSYQPNALSTFGQGLTNFGYFGSGLSDNPSGAKKTNGKSYGRKDQPTGVVDKGDY